MMYILLFEFHLFKKGGDSPVKWREYFFCIFLFYSVRVFVGSHAADKIQSGPRVTEATARLSPETDRQTL